MTAPDNQTIWAIENDYFVQQRPLVPFGQH